MPRNCKDSHLYKKIFHTLSVGRFSFLLLFYTMRNLFRTRGVKGERMVLPGCIKQRVRALYPTPSLDGKYYSVHFMKNYTDPVMARDS